MSVHQGNTLQGKHYSKVACKSTALEARLLRRCLVYTDNSVHLRSDEVA